MLSDAREERFDVVLAEDIDRLSRDEIESAAALRRRLEFLGIELHTCADGQVSKLHAGLKGLMSSLYLENLALHVRRGQSGNIRRGLSGGGVTYGYAVVKGEPGKRVIVEEEAAIVRRIFDEYVAGRRPREIAMALNADGVAPPRGRDWTGSTLNGNAKRSSGLLTNQIYAGRLVWNRVRMIKDPDTGRRISRPNPQSEWQVIEVPELRIVSADIFEKAQAIKRKL
jgi:site-specific DNA recombinase